MTAWPPLGRLVHALEMVLLLALAVGWIMLVAAWTVTP